MSGATDSLADGKILSNAVVAIFNERRVQEAQAVKDMPDVLPEDRGDVMIGGLIVGTQELTEKLFCLWGSTGPGATDLVELNIVAVSLGALSLRLVEAIERGRNG